MIVDSLSIFNRMSQTENEMNLKGESLFLYVSFVCYIYNTMFIFQFNLKMAEWIEYNVNFQLINHAWVLSYGPYTNTC